MKYQSMDQYSHKINYSKNSIKTHKIQELNVSY